MDSGAEETKKCDTTLNIVERSLLSYFFSTRDVLASAPDLDNVVVLDREFTGVGFLTDLEQSEALNVGSDNYNCTWSDVSGKLNRTLESGYLVFVVSGYITGLEGFRYNEEWPEYVYGIDLNPFDGTRST
jgi:hypothetical protein